MQPTNEVARSGRAFAWLTVLLGGAVLALYVFGFVVMVVRPRASVPPAWMDCRACKCSLARPNSRRKRAGWREATAERRGSSQSTMTRVFPLSIPL